MPYKDPSRQREYARQHYKENKSKYLRSNNLRRQALKQFIRALKEQTPCTDCSIQYPYYVMDFDHIHDNKELIKKFVHDNNKSGLKEELKKCEIVCSNCHRQRSFIRQHKV